MSSLLWLKGYAKDPQKKTTCLKLLPKYRWTCKVRAMSTHIRLKERVYSAAYFCLISISLLLVAQDLHAIYQSGSKTFPISNPQYLWVGDAHYSHRLMGSRHSLRGPVSWVLASSISDSLHCGSQPRPLVDVAAAARQIVPSFWVGVSKPAPSSLGRLLAWL